MKRMYLILCLVLLLSGNGSGKDVSGVTTEVLSKSGSSWDGRVLPGYPSGKPEITVLRIRIPPGTLLPLHKHPVINAGVLLSGELTIVTEDRRKLHLKAGEAIVEVVNTWHYGRNDCDKPAEIIVFYAGTQDSPITIKK